MTIREGKWRCHDCGEIIRGSIVSCASCGATRDANTKFFLDDADAPPLTDAALLRQAQAGADWLCSFCDNSNPAGATHCKSCNAEPQGKVKKSGDVVPPIAPLRAAAEEAADPKPSPAAPALAAVATPAAPSSGGGLAGLMKGAFGLVFALVLLSCCCFTTLLTRGPGEVTATVARVEWQRSIDVEGLVPVQRQQWDSAPQGAYDVTHQRSQNGTRQVQTGTKTVYTKEKYQSGTHTVTTQEQVQSGTRTVYRKEKVRVGSHKVVTGHKDMGNGFFEDVTKDVPDYEMKDVPHEEPNYVLRDAHHEEPTYSYRDVPHQEPVYVSEPVWGELYSFTIDQWQTVRTPASKGAADAPRWPDLGLGPKERESTRHEEYGVWFSVPNGTRQPALHPDAEDFARYAPGTAWKLSSANDDAATVLGPAGATTGG